jgi:hypothetical protein
MADPSSSGASLQRNVHIPPETQAKFPEFIELILGSESMNDEERQYWVNILPIMTPEQRESLRDILTNERMQLQAIDAKYAADAAKIGNEQYEKALAEERRKRRMERTSAESANRTREEKAADDLLETIEHS